MIEIAIIGDVGGHADALERVLRELGIDPDTGSIPAGLLVVQAGDLVDGGPDSARVLTIVTRCMERSPGGWIQLVGNHDYAYAVYGMSLHRQSIDPVSIVRLRDMYARGDMQFGVALDLDGLGPTLVTHAGLTAGAWVALGSPATPEDAVAALASAPEVIEASGRQVAGSQVNFAAGPLLADGEAEVRASWREHVAAGGVVPFSEVHGHNALRDSIVTIGGRSFQSVDCSLGRTRGADLRAFTFGGRVLRGPSTDLGHGLGREIA